MKSAIWTKAIKGSADPARARHFLGLLSGTASGLQRVSEEQARVLAAVFSGSEASSNQLVARPEWLSLVREERLKFPRRKQGLHTELTAQVNPLLEQKDYATALNRVREFKQREMLRI